MQTAVMYDELTDLLADLPRHAQDERIAYCPDDPSLYVPLVREGFIKAAIIPCANREEFNSAATAAAAKFFDLYKTNVLFPCISQAMLSLLCIKENRLFTANTGATEITDLVDPLLIKELRRCEAAAIVASSATEHDVVPLAYPENSGRRGINPYFHEDFSNTAYISFFGGELEFVTGDLTPEQKQNIKALRGASIEEIEEKLPDMKGRFTTLAHGDMMYFGDTFLHRSSSHIPVAGQLAFNIIP